ncbi:hypothetical protein B0H10DRAFT_1950453 [Mycena sp. CBHHK59/15]|nr:hypothetical protein B0H10DRAFT_1950453 [Mycena sp. CBHHK59/15]
MSVPRLKIPSTPVSNHTYPGLSGPAAYRPAHSSPLAPLSPLVPTGSSPGSSPIAAAQARRRAQYKARVPSTPVASSSRAAIGDAGDDPQKAFLRTRLKLRCIERASKARARAVQKKRYMSSSEAGSDDMDARMEMDDEEGEQEDPIFDELFTRIMHNTTRKAHHAYLYSYDREVGSSFDPGLEDAQNWEHELAAEPSPDEIAAVSAELDDADDRVLQAYLEEQAAFADFADIPVDELFSWSDLEEDLGGGHGMRMPLSAGGGAGMPLSAVGGRGMESNAGAMDTS